MANIFNIFSKKSETSEQKAIRVLKSTLSTALIHIRTLKNPNLGESEITSHQSTYNETITTLLTAIPTVNQVITGTNLKNTIINFKNTHQTSLQLLQEKPKQNEIQSKEKILTTFKKQIEISETQDSQIPKAS